MEDRNILFISHANPEDNEFARWLALQLAREGFAVWCDQTKLLGGERFWEEIESAIGARTSKFVFVLSQASNRKSGTIRELKLASDVAAKMNLADFVVPLRIDGIRWSDVADQLAGINGIDFSHSWADGLASLVKKLRKDGIPVDPRFTPKSVNSWWGENHTGNDILVRQSDIYLSNWFPICQLPRAVFVHLQGQPTQEPKLGTLAFLHGNAIVSFADAKELGIRGARTWQVTTEDFLAGTIPDIPFERERTSDAIVYLLRSAWIRYLGTMILPVHTLAEDNLCVYFDGTIVDASKYVTFNVPGLGNRRRRLTGRDHNRFWHFGISADIRLRPITSLAVRGHVLFSDDGKRIWTSASRLHRARRSLCKDWWNAEWRDRTIAAMHVLAARQESDKLVVPVSNRSSMEIATKPVTFDSPISYANDKVSQEPEFEEYLMLEDLPEELGERRGE